MCEDIKIGDSVTLSDKSAFKKHRDYLEGVVEKIGGKFIHVKDQNGLVGKWNKEDIVKR